MGRSFNMRYFRIYADESNPQPRFLDWYTKVKPGRPDREIYSEMLGQNHFQVELNEEIPFMDLISYPYFMVSKEFAALLRLYNPYIQFKYATLFDKANGRTAFFQIPNMPEVDCLHKKSEISKNKSEIITGVLTKESIPSYPAFRLGGIKGRYIMANLEFVESAYRREVTGMRIEEFMIE
jgi:hypothetical protein